MAVPAEYDQAVTLVNIANPANPQLSSVIKHGRLGFNNMSDPTKVALAGSLLAIASASSPGAITLVDVTNPGNPIKRSEIILNDGFYGMALAGNVLVIGTSVSPGTIELWDVSNPAMPDGVTIIPVGSPGSEIYSLAISGNRLVAGDQDPMSGLDEISYWDIATLVQPRLLGVAKDTAFSAHHLKELRATFVGTNLAVLGGSFSDTGFSLLSFVPQPTGILSDGWVGIGTRAPTAPLSVVGSVRVDGADFFQVQASRIQLGGGSTRSADGSVAIGFDVTASGWGSSSFGLGTSASGYASTALGAGTSASGQGSTASGQGSTASGNSSTAFGTLTMASGDYSTAMGYTSIAGGTMSTVMGYSTTARSYAEVALGLYNVDDTYSTPAVPGSFSANDRLFVIGNGSYSSRANALTMLKNGFTGFGSVLNPAYRIDLPNTGSPSGQGRANAWQTYSDARLKKAIAPIHYGLETVMELKPRAYEQHGGQVQDGKVTLEAKGKRQVGFVAQEVIGIVPEAVTAPADESKDFWSLDYQKLVPVLTKAIQELKAENDALRRRVEALEARSPNPSSALPAGRSAPAR